MFFLVVASVLAQQNSTDFACKYAGELCGNATTNPSYAFVCINKVCICNFGVASNLANVACSFTFPITLQQAEFGHATVDQIQAACSYISSYRQCYQANSFNCTKVYSNQPDGCSVVWGDRSCSCTGNGTLCPVPDDACSKPAAVLLIEKYCPGGCTPLPQTSTSSRISVAGFTSSVASSTLSSTLSNFNTKPFSDFMRNDVASLARLSSVILAMAALL